jgi:RimJ/RimL family protein N-acetyltransferase
MRATASLATVIAGDAARSSGQQRERAGHLTAATDYHPSMATASAPRLELVTLEGSLVRLEPLSFDHVPALAEVALDPTIWRWTIAHPTTEAELRAWAEAAIAAREAGAELPFATVDLASGRPIGSSRYMNIFLEHRRLEIGWTWVGTRFQRTGANREAKLLMLAHAFDTLGCLRVEFKTDALNEPSRTALLGIGARFEGIFRNHMVMPDGRMRDSAYYSVIDSEWPEVRAALEARLNR